MRKLASLMVSAVVLIGYTLAEYIEQRQAKKARLKVVDDVIFGWEQCKDDPTHEEKGDWTRVRLVGQNQIIAARIADLVARMP